MYTSKFLYINNWYQKAESEKKKYNISTMTTTLNVKSEIQSY